MSKRLARTDRSILGTWWWTVDRFMLLGFCLLATVGVVMMLATGPGAAQDLGLTSKYHFLQRHLTFLLPGAALLLFASVLAPRGVLRLAWLMTAVFGCLLVLTLFGQETKGATRWIPIGGLKLQPSEFLKPALAVACAWLVARKPGMSGAPQALALIVPVVAVLLLQPDLGMTVLVVGVFAAQLFVAGLGWGWITAVGGAGVALAVGAYSTLDHVRTRIDNFFDPTAEVYQVDRAMEAVAVGGLWGKGPGEGVVKFQLPEAHTDFVFVAAAEEFGIVACGLVLLLFAALVLRGFAKVQSSEDRFVQIAGAGLVVQLGLQSMINMAVNLNLVPTKGMTLPFISYGGSSMLALSIGMGMLLALTRRMARLRMP